MQEHAACRETAQHQNIGEDRGEKGKKYIHIYIWIFGWKVDYSTFKDFSVMYHTIVCLSTEQRTFAFAIFVDVQE